MLKLYASREMAQGSCLFGSNTLLMVGEFADSFEYEETEDQLKTIEEVENDLENDKPADRSHLWGCRLWKNRNCHAGRF